jgi:hypothetical protein
VKENKENVRAGTPLLFSGVLPCCLIALGMLAHDVAISRESSINPCPDGSGGAEVSIGRTFSTTFALVF